MGVADRIFRKDIILKGFWMRMDDFEGQYAHGFSIALDPVLCCVGLKEPSAIGFRISFGHTSILHDGCKDIFDNCGFGPGMGARRRCVI